MAGLSKEIGKNQEIIQAFASGNRIQQAAIAKSLGMSADQVAKMIYFEQIEAGLTEQQARTAAGITEDEAKRLGIQQQMSKAIEKLTEVAAPLLESFAALLDNTTAVYGIIGAIAGIKLAGIIGSVISLASSLAAAGVGASITANALTLGVGAIAIAGGIALVAAAAGAFRDDEEAAIEDAQDGVIGSDGRLVVKGPKGSVRLDSEDTIVANKNGVIAGTNLGGGNNRELISRLDKLIAATEKGTTITMDGNLVGKSIANTTSRLG